MRFFIQIGVELLSDYYYYMFFIISKHPTILHIRQEYKI